MLPYIAIGDALTQNDHPIKSGEAPRLSTTHTRVQAPARLPPTTSPAAAPYQAPHLIRTFAPQKDREGGINHYKSSKTRLLVPSFIIINHVPYPPTRPPTPFSYLDCVCATRTHALPFAMPPRKSAPDAAANLWCAPPCVL